MLMEHFVEKVRLAGRDNDETTAYVDHDFLRSLKYGIPPARGMRVGMDRLIMFLTNSQSIQQVLFFPQMKSERRIAADINLTQEEKDLFEILKNNCPILLIDLKAQAGLSNKQSDKTIKRLTKHVLLK